MSRWKSEGEEGRRGWPGNKVNRRKVQIRNVNALGSCGVVAALLTRPGGRE